MAKALGARGASVVVHPNGGEHRVVLEGGSIDVNGCSTLLRRKMCLLSTTQQAQSAMDRAAYEQLFADYFGVQSVIWLDSGIAGDDTHGHVDDITRFVAPNTWLRWSSRMSKAKTTRHFMRTVAIEGRPRLIWEFRRQKLEIVEIPMPRPVVFEEPAVAASYANFILRNGVCSYRFSTIRTIASR